MTLTLPQTLVLVLVAPQKAEARTKDGTVAFTIDFSVVPPRIS